MGKPTRQNTSSEFSGFAAFASHTSSASAALTRRVQEQQQQQQQQQSQKKSSKKKETTTQRQPSNVSGTSNSNSNSNGTSNHSTGSTSNSNSSKLLKPNPIFTGTDAQLIQIFKRIGQKRDSTTKTRALAELIQYAYPSKTAATSTSTTTILKKSEQIIALSHYFFLFSNKLIHDNNSSVRSEAIRVLGCAIDHVPKAFKTLLLYTYDDQLNKISALDGGAATAIGSIGNVIGWVYTSIYSQIMEVSRTAKDVWTQITTLLEDQTMQKGKETNASSSPNQIIQQQMTTHVESILQNSSRATNLADALSVLGSNNNSNNGNKSSSGGDYNKSKKGGKNKSAKNVPPPSAVTGGTISESDREEMEERYERVILLTMKGMTHFLANYSEINSKATTNDNYENNILLPYDTQFKNCAVLWKHLSNTRSNFRRASYTLLASICQHASSIIHPLSIQDQQQQNDTIVVKPHNLSMLIIKSLSSEKDPSNIPSLFELILLYIASFRKYGDTKSAWNTDKASTNNDSTTTNNIRTCCIGMNTQEFIKTLVKVLRRACHGSPSSQWSPSMLPLIVSLPSMEDQLQILAALWSGHTSAVNAVDAFYIVAAVSECSTYLLLQSKDQNSNNNGAIGVDDDIGIQLSMEIAQAFLESFKYYLSTPSSGNAALNAEQHLKMTLVKDVNRLDTLGSTKENCSFSPIRQWFWQEGMTKVMMMSSNNGGDDDDQLSLEMLERMDGFINGIIETSKEDDKSNSQSNLHPVLQLLFWTKLQPKEAEIPIAEEVSLMVRIINFCGIDCIFCDETGLLSVNAMEHFCASALLNWILFFMASNHDEGGGQHKKELVPLFTMLSILLPMLERRGLLWESLLNEIVNAGCDLKKLSIGLKVLTTSMDVESCKDLVCVTLDSIAIQAAARMLQQRRSRIMSNDDESENEMVEESKIESSFLRTCVGIKGGITTCLVSSNAIINLIDLCGSEECQIPFEHTNPLLEILLSLCTRSICTINEENIVKLLIALWKEGSNAWNMKELQELMKPNSLKYSNFINTASSILKLDISRSIGIDEDVELASLIWSERAWRLIQIINLHVEKSDKVADLIGLSNPSIWRSAINNKCTKQSDFLYKSLGRLLEKYSNEQDRNKLMSHIEAEEKQLSTLVLILMTLSKNMNDSTSYTMDCCSQFSSMLGDLGNEMHFKDLVSKIITSFTTFMKENSSDDELRSCVMVLDWAMELNIKKISVVARNDSPDIVADEVNVGDELWYIVDSSKEDSERVKVTIESIHSDDYPNYYFTIKVGNTSRQTIPSRLKYDPLPLESKQAPHELVPWIEETIASRLIKPYFLDENQLKNEAAAECLNMIISRCGLKGNAGIGSTRYDIFQLLTKLGQNTVQKINHEELSALSLPLRRLSLALGYGVYSSSSEDNASVLRFGCEELMTKLLDFYESDDGVLLTEGELARTLSSSMVMWLTVASKSTLNEANASQIWSLANAIVTEASKHNFYGIHKRWLDMTIKMYESIKIASSALPGDYNALTMDAEQSIISCLIQAFVGCEIEDIKNEINSSINKPFWLRDFQTFVFKSMENSTSSAVAFGARQQIEGLCECLLVPQKQWCAFQLLSKATKREYELYKKDDDLLPSTCSRLDNWLKNLEDEEASEIEEDVLITGMWIPRFLMNALEEFGEKDTNESNENEALLTGNLLQWLICLEFLDTAASSDMRNRTHIGSYLKLTGAIKFIVEAALQFATLDTRQGNNNWFKCMSIDNNGDDLALTQLSTLVLFRIVETVPTLFKSWWNDDCPRSMQNLVNKFVEGIVAPETLRRELDRIRLATNLDELDVSGSCVSREVVATYIQDECKLSVLIRVPSSFPLRNVEVDCKKTLGIPEKRWRHWALQIMLMLNSQDGSILDALMLWKQNVDKEFEGVEPCPVCYSVLCVKTHAMPNLECKTCHNRFHSSCLYKWFSSSGKNQCVLCQQPWSGTKVGK